MNKFANLPCLLLLSIVIKVLITGASIGDSVGIIALSALCGWWWYLEQTKIIPLNDSVKQDITNLREEMNTLKSSLNSVKLAAGVRRI